MQCCLFDKLQSIVYVYTILYMFDKGQQRYFLIRSTTYSEIKVFVFARSIA